MLLFVDGGSELSELGCWLFREPHSAPSGLSPQTLGVRLRHDTHNPGEVTGYAVGLPGDLTADGDQIYYGGGKLAPDLTLPKLRRRWP